MDFFENITRIFYKIISGPFTRSYIRNVVKSKRPASVQTNRNSSLNRIFDLIDNRNLRNGQPASLNRPAHVNRPAHAQTVRQAHVAYRTQQETDYQSNNPDSYLSQPRNPQVREKILINSEIKI